MQQPREKFAILAAVVLYSKVLTVQYTGEAAVIVTVTVRY